MPVAHAQRIPAHAGDRRTTPRLQLSLVSTLDASGEAVVIHDISATGMLLESVIRLDKDAHLTIDLPEVGATEARVVWSSGEYFGCQFVRPIGKGAISAALLRNPIVSVPAEPVASETLANPVWAEEEGSADASDPDELSFGTKLRVILLASLALWALIIAAIVRLWPG